MCLFIASLFSSWTRLVANTTALSNLGGGSLANVPQDPSFGMSHCHQSAMLLISFIRDPVFGQPVILERV
jgi:hypothetical protein